MRHPQNNDLPEVEGPDWKAHQPLLNMVFPFLSESIEEIESHRFKPSEWLYIKKCQELVDLLKEFQDEFEIKEWDLEDIRYFLQLKHYLYPKAYFGQHHVRAIATIIRNDWVCRVAASVKTTLRDIMIDLSQIPVVEAECPIHPDCVHKEDCNRAMCHLYFPENVTFVEVVNRIRKYDKPLETREDARKFLKDNKDLVKTMIPYDWLCAHLYWAKVVIA